MAEAQIDRFTSDVILPLAAQTNAIIICAATTSSCILSDSVTRMYGLHRAKWGGKPPFTIISTCGVPHDLYRNPDTSACWRDVRKQSKAWRQRDKMLLDLVAKQYKDKETGGITYRAHDLDPNAMFYLIVDGIDAKKGRDPKCGVKRSFNFLMNEMVRHLASSLPSLAIKTGNADKMTMSTASSALSSLAVAMDAAQSGTPLLLLDVRERELLKGASRNELIASAMEKHSKQCEALFQVGLCETFDCCTIAYFQEVVSGDGNSLTTEKANGMSVDAFDEGAREKNSVPLHKAIQYARRGIHLDDEEVQRFARPTPKQIDEVAQWIADKTFADAWAILPDREKREKRGDHYHAHFRDRILGMTGFISTLLNSPNCHALNLSDYEGAKKLVDQLVRLDRLPKENPIEGLLLMQEAWGLYDVAMHLADQYKLWSKVIFFIQLLLVFLVVISTAIGSLTFTITQEGEGRRLQLVSSDGGEFVSVWLPSLSGAGIVEVEYILERSSFQRAFVLSPSHRYRSPSRRPSRQSVGGSYGRSGRPRLDALVLPYSCGRLRAQLGRSGLEGA